MTWRPLYDETALAEAFGYRQEGESARSLLARWERWPEIGIDGRTQERLDALRVFVELSYEPEEA